ncbi:hypothetical protein E2562_018292 [Oryza meyeriana var. granulata]|uniref:Uncharacterized protein n=1 Tax=Oryza meyeriana var. granulata TaxID=110450 RepID=A0A6G1CS26_9ORYZ|nr:hypothetical protein E2562_018292 [Oryza meyeriana var. granulata]
MHPVPEEDHVLLNDDCCNGVQSIYEALTTDAVDIGFVCHCLQSLVAGESLRPYLYRILKLRGPCRLKDLGPIPFNSSTVQDCRRQPRRGRTHQSVDSCTSSAAGKKGPAVERRG